MYCAMDLKTNQDRQNLVKAWDNDIIRIAHDLPTNDLFSKDALIDLIRENPDCVAEAATMDNSSEDSSTWKQTSLKTASADELFKAVESGSIWTNLKNVGHRDQRYQKLLDEIIEKLVKDIPQFEPYNHQIGILISSPDARVFYHADVPGQALLQIQGEKTIWLYPGKEPYLNQADFEKVVIGKTAEEISYDPSFENVATKLDLKPGQGLFWPLNWPHRVVNGPMVNVSATIEYSTKKTRRHYNVNYANGLLSQTFGYRPRSQAISGLNYWSKFLISYSHRHMSIGNMIKSKPD